MFGSLFPDPSPCGAGSAVLKRAAWSSRAKLDDAVASIQQSKDLLHRDRLHAGLELQLPVPSCTCCLRPSPNAVGLLLLSFPPALVALSDSQSVPANCHSLGLGAFRSGSAD